MKTLQSDRSFLLAKLEKTSSSSTKRGNKYITPAKTWSTLESKAILFDSLKDAKLFLSSSRLKASVFVDRSFTTIRSRSNGGTVVETECKLIKID